MRYRGIIIKTPPGVMVPLEINMFHLTCFNQVYYITDMFLLNFNFHRNLMGWEKGERGRGGVPVALNTFILFATEL